MPSRYPCLHPACLAACLPARPPACLLRRFAGKPTPDEAVFATLYAGTAGGGKGQKGLYPGWDKDLHYAASLDFFKTPVVKMVPCGNLFEVRLIGCGPAAALGLQLTGWGAAACCRVWGCSCWVHEQMMWPAAGASDWRRPACTALFPLPCCLCRLSHTRCTWRFPPSAPWAPTASLARLPPRAWAAAQVRGWGCAGDGGTEGDGKGGTGP